MPANAAAPRHAATYAPRARLGLIVPPTNTVNEGEWARMVPDGVTFHTMRMALHADTTSAEGQAALWRDLEDALKLLVPCRPDVIAYACTAGSMIIPPESVADRMAARAALPCITTALAIIHALRALGAARVAVATPYHDALNDHEVHFLEACGIATTRLVGLGIGAGGPQEYIRIAETPRDQVRAHVRSAVTPDAQALLISCTDFPALTLVPELEAEFGIPVVTSNTATLWAALRAAGITDAVGGGGRLFNL